MTREQAQALMDAYIKAQEKLTECAGYYYNYPQRIENIDVTSDQMLKSLNGYKTQLDRVTIECQQAQDAIVNALCGEDATE